MQVLYQKDNNSFTSRNYRLQNQKETTVKKLNFPYT
jgi:hypothetical protein